MAYEPLLDSWHDSREERTHLHHGERSGSIEKAINGSMTPWRTWMDWLHLDRDDYPPRSQQQLDRDDRELE